MEPTTLGILCAASLGTAAVSAVLGMAGGILLLGVMVVFLEPAAAIPIHAVVQLVSNSSRTVVHARSVRRDLLGPYALLLVPAGILTVPLAQHAPADALRLAIGGFVLVATWRSRWLLLGLDPERLALGPRFLLLGGAAGAVGPLVGATGPFIAPFFLGLGLTRYELIGTKAACQTAGHLAKIVLFGVAGFAFLEHAALTTGMAAATILGTVLGTRVLHHVDDQRFTLLYKVTLTAVALRLVWSGLAALAAPTPEAAHATAGRVEPEPMTQGAAGDAQAPGGQRDVATGALDGPPPGIAFTEASGVGTSRGRASGIAASGAAGDTEWRQQRREQLGRRAASVGPDRRGLEDVRELAEIAGPGMPGQEA